MQGIFPIFQAMIEKLKSQLEAAHKVKESHATQMKLRETSTTKQVCNVLFCWHQTNTDVLCQENKKGSFRLFAVTVGLQGFPAVHTADFVLYLHVC